MRFVCRPNFVNFLIRISWFIVSKAFRKSRNMAVVAIPLLAELHIEFVNFDRLLIVDL